jgi:hypothetical protein
MPEGYFDYLIIGGYSNVERNKNNETFTSLGPFKTNKELKGKTTFAGKDKPELKELN